MGTSDSTEPTSIPPAGLALRAGLAVPADGPQDDLFGVLARLEGELARLEGIAEEAAIAGEVDRHRQHRPLEAPDGVGPEGDPGSPTPGTYGRRCRRRNTSGRCSCPASARRRSHPGYSPTRSMIRKAAIALPQWTSPACQKKSPVRITSRAICSARTIQYVVLVWKRFRVSTSTLPFLGEFGGGDGLSHGRRRGPSPALRAPSPGGRGSETSGADADPVVAVVGEDLEQGATSASSAPLYGRSPCR